MLFVGISSFAQSVWIADNRPTAAQGDHIFTTVAEAITAASPGDIIHIIPSQFSYGSWTVTKDSLTIFGIGYNPDKEQPSLSNNAAITIGLGTFGTRLAGLTMNVLVLGSTATGSLGNIFIEKCRINEIEGNNGFGV